MVEIMKKEKKRFYVSAGFLLAFLLWTIAVCFVDVQAIGPRISSVGLAEINRFVHDLTGVHLTLYALTDWLSLIPVAVCLLFAAIGVKQLIERKNLLKVDFSILILGIFYLVVIAAYVFFEAFPVNYRPVLLDGCLEASYPSSTTMLVICVMMTALMQIDVRIKNKLLKRSIDVVILTFITFMVIGRLVSGVHWFSDIVGGVLLSIGLVMMYDWIIKKGQTRK